MNFCVIFKLLEMLRNIFSDIIFSPKKKSYVHRYSEYITN